jgi:cell wall-associated NlpC family hydrolase
MKRSEVVSRARSLLGTPYIHQGRRPYSSFGEVPFGVGVDCIGLILSVAWSFGVASGFDFRAYGREPDPDVLRDNLCRFLAEIPVEEAREGDILLFRIRRDPQHTAFLARRDGEPSMIHAYQNVGRVVENRLDERWVERITNAYKFPEIED